MSSPARRTAVVLVILVSAGYTIAGVVDYLLKGDLRTDLIVLAAVTVFYVPHYLNLRAAFRGERPRFLAALLVIQAVAAYLPDFWLVNGWAAGTGPIFAGVLLLLLPMRAGGTLVGLIALWHGAFSYRLTEDIGTALYFALTVLITSGMIYSVVRLLRTTVELEEARADLAEAAVLKERLRISRDLHDGLGRSLTAIALKGDLAVQLMDREPEAARNEVGEVVQLAREAAHDVRQVARGYREMSLSGEVSRAVSLLETSGIDCQVNLSKAELSRESEVALAWGV